MRAVDLRREKDIEQLRRVALAQQAQIEQLLKVLRAKCDELATLKGSEEELQQTVVPQLCELDEADKTCPSCGGELRPMKDQFETSEMIDVVEVSYRGRYSLDFAVKVAIDKYLDHIPLARQERILRRHGLVVITQTLWDQLHALARRLESASRALLARVLAEPVIGLDQTSWPRLDGKGDKPWQMWCLTAPGVVVHPIKSDKGTSTFKSLIGDYQGFIVCDALKTHEAGVRGNDRVALAGCRAHVFRKFEEASPDHPEAHLAMKWIGELYAIDERAEGDLAEKAELRKKESAEIIATMKTWLWSRSAGQRSPRSSTRCSRLRSCRDSILRATFATRRSAST